MANNYKKKVGQGWQILSIFLAFVLVVTGTLFGVLAGVGVINFGKDDKVEDTACEHVYVDGVCSECGEAEPTDNGSPVTGEEGEELPSDAAIPMPSMMTFRSATNLDGEDAEYDSVTLTATVKPDNASNKLVDWTISFVDSSSEWATGKTATDYVTVTPAEDGSTTATVQCLQPFGEQVQITVTSRENTEATASCTIDFAKRISELNLLGNYTDSSEVMGTKILNYNVVSGSGSITLPEIGKILISSATPTYTAYTVDDTFTVASTVKANEDTLNQFMSDSGVSGYSASPFNMFFSTTLNASGSTSLNQTGGVYLPNTIANVSTLKVISGEDFNKLNDWLVENPGAVVFDLTINVSGTYSNASRTISLLVNSDTLTYKVTGVELDQSNVII